MLYTKLETRKLNTILWLNRLFRWLREIDKRYMAKYGDQLADEFMKNRNVNLHFKI
jgi:hypothetical protein